MTAIVGVHGVGNYVSGQLRPPFLTAVCAPRHQQLGSPAEPTTMSPPA
jgi:hypothetical protein